MIVAVEGGADPGTVAKTLETEVVCPPMAATSAVSQGGVQLHTTHHSPSLQHHSGALLLVSSNRTLVPLASTFSVTYVAAGSNIQDGSNVAAIVVPVVVGVVVIVAIVAATIVILVSVYCSMW